MTPGPAETAPGSQTPLERWGDRLDDAVDSLASPWIACAIVLRETASTQDAALAMSGGRAGWFVVASAQSRGRGRLGRAWTQPGHLGVAATLTVDPAAVDGEGRSRGENLGSLSLRAGLAACGVVERFVGEETVGIRWPNDVVTRRWGSGTGRGRKLAGILIEQRGGLLLVGIGINVLQQPGDWPADLRDSAASIRDLVGEVDRLAVAEEIARALHHVLEAEAPACIGEWRRRDVLVGRNAVFRSAGRDVAGRVVDIDPACELVVETDTGRLRLDAAATTLVSIG